MLEMSAFANGVAAAAIAGTGATALGALPVFLFRSMSPRLNNLLLAFAAGIMLAATVFSLLIPALDEAKRVLPDGIWPGLSVIAALFVGGGTIALVHGLLPHEHFEKGREGVEPGRMSRIWLFVVAIAIHNFPEGLSVGVGAASDDPKTAFGVTLGIGLQNLPEGLSVAVALLGLGYSRTFAFLVAAGTGVLELLGGIAGAGAVAMGPAILPWALAFAAGAMLFVVSDEIIPETHRAGFAEGATAALFAGFGVMMLLDTM